jgi:hypothetical protein
VKLLSRSAPARAFKACAGVFVFCSSFVACDEGPRLGGGDRTLELNADTVTLEAGTNLHDIQVKSGGNGDFAPTSITVRTKDIIRLTTADTRTHALTITAPTPEATSILETSGQRRSPPLVAQGQSWVVSMKGLPAGSYVVSCLSHAGTATVRVQ